MCVSSERADPSCVKRIEHDTPARPRPPPPASHVHATARDPRTEHWASCRPDQSGGTPSYHGFLLRPAGTSASATGLAGAADCHMRLCAGIPCSTDIIARHGKRFPQNF
eukprot:scaffold43532_cov34-Tisochrysis_lutea.AAC.3